MKKSYLLAIPFFSLDAVEYLKELMQICSIHSINQNSSQKQKVYCGHEYTKSNLSFCLKYDPNNPGLKENQLKLIQK